jgi:hypothetical protein
VLFESVETRTIRRKLLEDDEDMIFLLSLVSRVTKEGSGIFGNRRAVGHRVFIYLFIFLLLKIRIEILHTTHWDSQSDHAPGLGYSSRGGPYYPVPLQVRGFELSVEIM